MKSSSVAVQSIASIPIVLYGYLVQKTWGALEGVMVEFPMIEQMGTLTLAYGFIALALALAGSRVRTDRGRVRLLAFGATLQVLSSLVDIVVTAASLHHPALLFLSFALKAGGTMVVSALWIELYALLNPVRAGFLCAASTAVSAVLLFVLSQVTGEHLLVARLFLTALSCCLYYLSYKDLKVRDLPSGKSEFKAFVPIKGVAFVLVCSFAYGMASFMLHANNTNYASIVPAAVVMLLILVSVRSFSSMTLYRLILPLMIGGFLLASFASTELHFVSSLMLDTGYGSMELLLLLMVCAMAYSAGGSAVRLFGFLAAAQFFGQFAGSLFAFFLHANVGTSEFVALEVLAMVLVVAVSPALLTEKSMTAFWHGPADIFTPDDEEAKVRLRVSDLAARYGLTEREREVLLLAARGKTNAAIAGDMILSEGTVKTHLHNVYQKFGVHTRTELMDIVSR